MSCSSIDNDALLSIGGNNNTLLLDETNKYKLCKQFTIVQLCCESIAQCPVTNIANIDSHDRFYSKFQQKVYSIVKNTDDTTDKKNISKRYKKGNDRFNVSSNAYHAAPLDCKISKVQDTEINGNTNKRFRINEMDLDLALSSRVNTIPDLNKRNIKTFKLSKTNNNSITKNNSYAVLDTNKMSTSIMEFIEKFKNPVENSVSISSDQEYIKKFKRSRDSHRNVSSNQDQQNIDTGIKLDKCSKELRDLIESTVKDLKYQRNSGIKMQSETKEVNKLRKKKHKSESTISLLKQLKSNLLKANSSSSISPGVGERSRCRLHSKYNVQRRGEENKYSNNYIDPYKSEKNMFKSTCDSKYNDDKYNIGLIKKSHEEFESLLSSISEDILHRFHSNDQKYQCPTTISLNKSNSRTNNRTQERKLGRFVRPDTPHYSKKDCTTGLDNIADDQSKRYIRAKQSIQRGSGSQPRANWDVQPHSDDISDTYKANVVHGLSKHIEKTDCILKTKRALLQQCNYTNESDNFPQLKTRKSRKPEYSNQDLSKKECSSHVRKKTENSKNVFQERSQRTFHVFRNGSLIKTAHPTKRDIFVMSKKHEITSTKQYKTKSFDTNYEDNDNSNEQVTFYECLENPQIHLNEYRKYGSKDNRNPVLKCKGRSTKNDNSHKAKNNISSKIKVCNKRDDIRYRQTSHKKLPQSPSQDDTKVCQMEDSNTESIQYVLKDNQYRSQRNKTDVTSTVNAFTDGCYPVRKMLIKKGFKNKQNSTKRVLSDIDISRTITTSQFSERSFKLPVSPIIDRLITPRHNKSMKKYSESESHDISSSSKLNYSQIKSRNHQNKLNHFLSDVQTYTLMDSPPTIHLDNEQVSYMKIIPTGCRAKEFKLRYVKLSTLGKDGDASDPLCTPSIPNQPGLCSESIEHKVRVTISSSTTTQSPYHKPVFAQSNAQKYDYKHNTQNRIKRTHTHNYKKDKKLNYHRNDKSDSHIMAAAEKEPCNIGKGIKRTYNEDKRKENIVDTSNEIKGFRVINNKRNRKSFSRKNITTHRKPIALNGGDFPTNTDDLNIKGACSNDGSGDHRFSERTILRGQTRIYPLDDSGYFKTNDKLLHVTKCPTAESVDPEVVYSHCRIDDLMDPIVIKNSKGRQMDTRLDKYRKHDHHRKRNNIKPSLVDIHKNQINNPIIKRHISHQSYDCNVVKKTPIKQFALKKLISNDKIKDIKPLNHVNSIDILTANLAAPIESNPKVLENSQIDPGLTRDIQKKKYFHQTFSKKTISCSLNDFIDMESKNLMIPVIVDSSTKYSQESPVKTEDCVLIKSDDGIHSAAIYCKYTSLVENVSPTHGDKEPYKEISKQDNSESQMKSHRSESQLGPFDGGNNLKTIGPLYEEISPVKSFESSELKTQNYTLDNNALFPLLPAHIGSSKLSLLGNRKGSRSSTDSNKTHLPSEVNQMKCSEIFKPETEKVVQLKRVCSNELESPSADSKLTLDNALTNHKFVHKDAEHINNFQTKSLCKRNKVSMIPVKIKNEPESPSKEEYQNEYLFASFQQTPEPQTMPSKIPVKVKPKTIIAKLQHNCRKTLDRKNSSHSRLSVRNSRQSRPGINDQSLLRNSSHVKLKSSYSNMIWSNSRFTGTSTNDAKKMFLDGKPAAWKSAAIFKTYK